MKKTPLPRPLGRGPLEPESETVTEESMNAHIQPIDGKVIVTFPKSISYLAMPPDQAEQFGNLLIEQAKAARATLAGNKPPPGVKPS